MYSLMFFSLVKGMHLDLVFPGKSKVQELNSENVMQMLALNTVRWSVIIIFYFVSQK